MKGGDAMRLVHLAIFGLLAVWGVACAPLLPPKSDFTVPAVGTLIPGGHEEAVHPEIPAGQSGALLINQTGLRIQVAVNNTIADIPLAQDFLFILPPGTYEFYIYRDDSQPIMHKETLEAGKLRYLYISPLLGNTG